MYIYGKEILTAWKADDWSSELSSVFQLNLSAWNLLGNTD